jgi:hypothetical protein
MDEIVKIPAGHLLKVLLLVGECIEDLAEDEQVILEELDHALQTQAPDTFKAHSDHCETIGEFYKIAVEGGLMSMGPDFDAECQEFGCRDDGTDPL